MMDGTVSVRTVMPLCLLLTALLLLHRSSAEGEARRRVETISCELNWVLIAEAQKP